MTTIDLRLGDALAILRTLPSESVHCVVTSPPYWGLRDYGTGRWTGGDPACDHRSPTMREGRNEKRATLAGSASTNAAQLRLAHRSACGKCGAVKVDQQIGLEPTMADHIEALVTLFREVRRVLRRDGTVWLNYGDVYAGQPNGRLASQIENDNRTFRDKPFSTVVGVLKPKDLCMLPNRLAIALQEDGWWVRSEIVWNKTNPKPESIRDRPAAVHEKIWLLSKSARYFFDPEPLKEPVTGGAHARRKDGQHRPAKGSTPGQNRPGSWVETYVPELRNGRNVWAFNVEGCREAHFATFPQELARRCIAAGCPAGGVVLDPFMGSGTTALVARELGRSSIGVELNPAYLAIARRRLGLDVAEPAISEMLA